MQTKLALKNVSRSMRDYAVYFFTLAFGVCIFYMFNSIYAQQAMMDMTAEQTQSVKAIQSLLGYVSVFVAVVLGFLIIYANGFFVRRRKKEFGIYMTLGMQKSRISQILLLETSAIAVCALAVGLIAGVFLSQFMSIFTAKMFEASLTNYKFIFSKEAVLKSLLYFGIIFLTVIIFNAFLISRFKLIDLIGGAKKNQNFKIKKMWVCVVLFILSLGILVTAYYIINKNGIYYINKKFFASIILGTVGTLLFFFSLSGILTKLMQANKKHYYKGINMFVVRQLASKINSNFVSISVVCLVLLLTIGIFSCGYSMQTSISEGLRARAKFDHSYVYSAKTECTSEYDDFKQLEEALSGTNYAAAERVHLYTCDAVYADLGDIFPQELMDDDSDKELMIPLEFISLSEYNKIIEMQGAKPANIDQGKYLFVSNYDMITECEQKAVEANTPIDIGGTLLYPESKISPYTMVNNYADIMIVVDDAYVENMDLSIAAYNINFKSEADARTFDSTEISYNDYGISYSISKADIYDNSVTTRSVTSFVAIYLGLVFMITCAAVLAIQQLTEASDNKYRYDLLAKFGVEQKMLNRGLFTQILFYFGFPLVLAIVHSCVGLHVANRAIALYGHVNLALNITITALFIGALYGIYFAITYFCAKGIINRK